MKKTSKLRLNDIQEIKKRIGERELSEAKLKLVIGGGGPTCTCNCDCDCVGV